MARQLATVLAAEEIDALALASGPGGRRRELVGIAVLSTYRRRGLAAQVTRVMARAVRAHVVTTVFCSAAE